MALTAIHPGEHLAEELEVLDMNAAELARKIDVPTNRVTQIYERNARYHGRHGPAPRSFLRHECSVLAEFTNPLRPQARPGEGRKIHQGASDAAATATKLEKRVDSMKASPAKVAIEVKLADALFALNLESEAMTMSQKAMDLGLEIFRLDRLSHPGKVAFAADAFDSLLDLADILGRRVDPATAAQQIREVRD